MKTEKRIVMKKIIRNGLLMIAVGAIAVSCADYDTTDDFTAQKDLIIVKG